MSIETYEEIIGKIELYKKNQIGINQIKNGEIVSEEKMMKKNKRVCWNIIMYELIF